MASGVEAVGLALALLPLVVNQLDNYAHGIEQIKVLSRYQRTLEDFALQLGTQHRIFQNSLQHVLDEVVDDDNQLRDLISDPDGDSWKEPLLQKGLMAKLGRDHAYFFANVVSLHDMLKRMAVKLDVDVTRGPQVCPNFILLELHLTYRINIGYTSLKETNCPLFEGPIKGLV